jgi:FMN phosphatase YigB (HAD superfamily)
MTTTGLKALLLDLDDTLIDNPVRTFIPAYFGALKAFVADTVDPDRFIAELLAATRAMDRGDGTGPTNEEVFADAFYPALGVARDVLEPLLGRFYREAYPSLQPMVGPRPAAPKIVEWAEQQGLQVAIATNPLFPRTAIEQRMEWGGVGVDRFAYDLVTAFENCRATKSHVAYYRDIVSFLGRRPEECLMVGDNWDWDIACAGRAGVRGFWIAAADALPKSPEVEVVGQGSLDAFLRTAEDGGIEDAFEGSLAGRVAL